MRAPGQQGFTLIEALVSIVVFSIGMLGLVAMQTVSARVTTDARFRAEAAAAADELLGRMQTANRSTVAALYGTGGTEFVAWQAASLQAPGRGLPGAVATAEFGAVGGDPNTVRITVSWTPPRELQRNVAGEATAVAHTRQHVTVSALYD
ncbi:MAG TPA: type IV pilus modification protein PilV [Burkholderiaceae bacterium]|nr:type IV pilus modification protein PilV [Burkholderiaceae bacterium]